MNQAFKDKLHMSAKRQKKKLGQGREADFFGRIYSIKNMDFYPKRILSLGFNDIGSVYDAGCGYGQWSFFLAEMNQNVFATDYLQCRVDACNNLKKDLGLKNINFAKSDISRPPPIKKSFDGIFCFSVIYYTDFKKAFKQFYKSLKKGGKMYVCTNGLGWYMYNLIENRNASKDFSPRKYALETVIGSLKYYLLGKKDTDKSIIMFKSSVRKILKEIGFKEIQIAPEGKIRVDRTFRTKSIYDSSYLGITNVFEILAYK